MFQFLTPDARISTNLETLALPKFTATALNDSKQSIFFLPRNGSNEKTGFCKTEWLYPFSLQCSMGSGLSLHKNVVLTFPLMNQHYYLLLMQCAINKVYQISLTDAFSH